VRPRRGDRHWLDLPSDPTTGELRYMPLAHLDLIEDESSVMVSYSRNNTDSKKVTNDPFTYRPQFVRVTLPVLRRSEPSQGWQNSGACGGVL
jgi:hypothetical protein